MTAIDIQGIVDAKLQEMHDNDVLKNTIEQELEKMLLKAVTDALGGYDLRGNIQKQVSEQVSAVVQDIGFTAYNSFIAEKVREITERTCRADIAEKIDKVFNEMLVLKRDSIKLSEIFERYRKWVCEEVDEADKYRWEQFYVKFALEEKYDWYDVELAQKKPERLNSYDREDMCKFTIHKLRDGSGMGYIGSYYLNGVDIKDAFKLQHLSDFEALMVNLAFNRTPIEIDVEHEDDINCSYDVGY